MEKLYIVMVGLPARGKSTVATRLREAFLVEGIQASIFNNGEVRRKILGRASASPNFYNPDNHEGRAKREEIAKQNADMARAYLGAGGQVAILDATNASQARRAFLKTYLKDAPILFIECINDDPDLLAASVQRKARGADFAHLPMHLAVESFMQRIAYYEKMYAPLEQEAAFMRVDTLRNRILAERKDSSIPYIVLVRDVLVCDWVQELFLIRHCESEFNVMGRIGGDASLTIKGHQDAIELAEHFKGKHIPYIFISKRRRSFETAMPIKAAHPEATLISIPELDEINAGVCDGMTYNEIEQKMPDEFFARSKDKYNYIYPDGEGYISMRHRVERGFLKALFLSGGQPGSIIIGHQAVNRTILSLFLFRRTEDVPYIYIPQNQYFYIQSTHRRKLFELVQYELHRRKSCP